MNNGSEMLGNQEFRKKVTFYALPVDWASLSLRAIFSEQQNNSCIIMNNYTAIIRAQD